jgi:hypothetical protein
MLSPRGIGLEIATANKGVNIEMDVLPDVLDDTRPD